MTAIRSISWFLLLVAVGLAEEAKPGTTAPPGSIALQRQAVVAQEASVEPQREAARKQGGEADPKLFFILPPPEHDPLVAVPAPETTVAESPAPKPAEDTSANWLRQLLPFLGGDIPPLFTPAALPFPLSTPPPGAAKVTEIKGIPMLPQPTDWLRNMFLMVPPLQ